MPQLPHLNEREIGSAAADIHHEHQRDALERPAKILAMMRREVVERRLRFLQQREFFKTRATRCRDGQGSGYFIK